jgi:hypothetical protein
MQTNLGILFAAAPAGIVVLLLSGIVPGVALLGYQQSSTSDSMGAHGYVVVTVTRDGQEIYRNEQHNIITNAGKDFIAQQIGASSGLGTNGANYIALTTTAVTPAADHTSLAGEITSGGLARAQGNFTHTAGQNTFAIAKTFTASQSFTNVQGAGLFTASTGGIMMAENNFTAVNLANNDKLTITWTITLS